MRNTEWLGFIEINDSGKTKTWKIINKHSLETLGLVKWHGAFRKYAFFPEGNTIFDMSCLHDIIDFIYYQMKERK